MIASISDISARPAISRILVLIVKNTLFFLSGAHRTHLHFIAQFCRSWDACFTATSSWCAFVCPSTRRRPTCRLASERWSWPCSTQYYQVAYAPLSRQSKEEVLCKTNIYIKGQSVTPSVTSPLFITSVIARLYESAQVNVSLNMVIEGMSL